MHLMFPRSILTLVLTAVLAHANPETKYGGIAQFEPPRSVGTPLGDVARTYSGPGLADRIAGRLRLETDISLTEVARRLIRQHLALES